MDHSPLALLPGEIRNEIYTMVFVEGVRYINVSEPTVAHRSYRAKLRK